MQWHSQGVALVTSTFTRLLDNFLLRLCEQYKIKHLNFSPLQYTCTNVHGLATSLVMTHGYYIILYLMIDELC